MKRSTAQWVRKAEEDMVAAKRLAAPPKPPRDAVCFHCQQAAEKYLKALMQELALPIPYTHDLRELLDQLRPHDSTLTPLLRGLVFLTRFAVGYRYPGLRAKTREMHSALRHAERVRAEIRRRLGLPL